MGMGSTYVVGMFLLFTLCFPLLDPKVQKFVGVLRFLYIKLKLNIANIVPQNLLSKQETLLHS